jgi:uncharacterized protein with GYD domain
MPTYVILAKWTTQGIQKIKESPARLDAARKAFEGAGVKMKDFYMVMGQYDMVLVGEAADDAVFARAVISIAGGGNIQTETLKAFTEDEYRAIVLSLP